MKKDKILDQYVNGENIVNSVKTLFEKVSAFFHMPKRTEGQEPIPASPETFFHLSLSHAMIQRTDVIGISCTLTWEETFARFLKTGFRWLPVFRDTLDDIIGSISIYTLLTLTTSDAKKTWTQHLKEGIFVPESMKLEDAIDYFYASSPVPFIFVVDEHGGIQGMVTKSSILRGVCHLSLDQFVEEDTAILSKSPWIIHGRMDCTLFIQEFSRFLKEDHPFLTLKDHRFHTMGGWICTYLGRVPKTGEIFEQEGFTFEIRDATPKAIRHIAILSFPKVDEE